MHQPYIEIAMYIPHNQIRKKNIVHSTLENDKIKEE